MEKQAVRDKGLLAGVIFSWASLDISLKFVNLSIFVKQIVQKILHIQGFPRGKFTDFLTIPDTSGTMNSLP